ncbi:N-acetylmuramoyl-L-alanine amidase [Mechercharimyces sp. CAU 1602]|uniref:N-acetylmuramoyl-L-alanine amidase n=1 Tax=Mechercharimyces sp. CAU 1602 TaxID=2973933 RepID=UPI002161F875|nr:N-acetylmuramoyl-L-alanine amidase [Mechercharimyces sp. CAU 1602]MCS1350169.1 N-acetylmuramoyl-L-alanine amidase [Mechercharimyces sp. CAU 1602]
MTRLVIDPGHGGNDPGATNGSYQEKNFTLMIALKVRDYLLSRYNVEIYMTRTTDATVSLTTRTSMANALDADYYCSIHINAGGGTGFESYIYNGSVSQDTITKRNIIHDRIMQTIGSKYGVRNRGKKRANFHVLRETRMPAVLTENMFIDTSSDLALLLNPTFINDLAVATAEGLASALNLSPISFNLYKVIAGSFTIRSNADSRVTFLSNKGIDSFVLPTTINGSTYYRVQAGAYTDRNNAEAQLARINAAGISDAFIISV